MRYWSGLMTGLIVAALGALVALTRWGFPVLVEELPALAGDDAPRATGLVTSSAWGWGAPAAVAVLLVAATVLPRRRDTVRLVALILVFVAAAATLAFSFMGVYLPLGEIDWAIGVE